jgi:hypothetical protein
MLPLHLHDRLETIAGFHKVVAVLVGLFSSVFLLHFFFGLLVVLNPDLLAEGGDQPPPAFFGAMFMVVGAGIVLGGWTFAVFVWRTARFLRERRSWMRCMVVDGLLCTFAPFGTVLGIFGIMALNDPLVKAEFDRNAAAGRLPSGELPVPVPGGEVPGRLPYA